MRTRKNKSKGQAAEVLEPALLSTLRDAERDDGLVRRSFGITVKAVNQDARSVDVVASTEAIDAYDEVVVQDWDLSRYNSNPVVLWNHNKSSYFMCDPEDCLPIGFATNVAVKNGQLLATLNFVTAAANPLAEMIWQGVQQGSLRAVSVGFEPHTIVEEMIDDQEHYKLMDNELYEISVCPMGANPEAVAKSRAKATEQIRNRMKALHQKAAVPNAAPEKHQKEKTMEELEILKAKNAELTAKLETSGGKVAALEDQTKTLSAKVVDAEKALESERTKSVALNERCATLETERAAQQKRGDELAQKAVDKEITELVGVKISAAEKPGLVRLAALDEALFHEQLTAIKGRPDMKLLGAPVVGTDPAPPPSSVVGDADGSADLDADVQKSLRAN